MDCPSCSTSIPNDARFCPECGHKFDALPAAPDPGAKAAAAIDLAPADFARAFSRALKDSGRDEEGIEGVEPQHDPESLQRAGVAAGLDRKVVQKALHRISMEKLPADIRSKMGIVLDDEVPPPSRRWWLPVVAVVNIAAIALVVWAVFFRPPPLPPIAIKPQKGTLDVASLEEPVSALSTAAQACYDEGLKANPKMTGEVVLTLRVQLDAKVEATVAKESLNDATTVGCIVAAVQSQTWPAAKIAPVDVDIPLAFNVTSE